MPVHPQKATLATVLFVFVMAGFASCQRSAHESPDDARTVQDKSVPEAAAGAQGNPLAPAAPAVPSNGQVGGSQASASSPASQQGNPQPAAAQAPPGTRPTAGPIQQTAGQQQTSAGEAASETAPDAPMRFELADLIQFVEPAIVQINVSGGVGSGFVIDAKGIVATNYHVVEGAKSATVLFRNGTKARVSGVLAASPGKDVAILQIEGIPAGLTKSLRLSETLPRSGERVVAFGSPKGFSFSSSEGIVSAVRSGTEVRDIFVRTVGGDVYARLGYDLDTTWIQTSTPISPGNSGGPLVNMGGEVVGLNTWSRKGGQNLNFAISAIDIEALYIQADSEPVPLASLPTRSASPTERDADPADPDRVYGFKTITLPSGKSLSAKTLVAAMLRPLELIDVDTPTFSWDNDGGTIGGVCAHRRGKLHGVTSAFHETGKPVLLGVYSESKRDGPLLTWDDSGKLALYARYTHGNNDGLLCLFQKNKPWLIQDYEKGKLLESYLVRVEGDTPVLVPSSEAEQDEKMKAELERAVDELEEVEQRLAENERQIKRRLATAFRKEYQRMQREYLTKITPERRRQASERRQRKAAAAAAAHRQMRQSVRRGGLPF